MNAPAAILKGETRCLLRVYGGRLDGAQFRMPPERRMTLGHGFDNDIVIRGEGTKGSRLELQADGDRVQVRLLSGAAHLLGQPLVCDQPAVLPTFVPLAIGEYRFAIGEEGHERWDQARALALHTAHPRPASDPRETATGTLPQARLAGQRMQSASRYLPGWLTHPATMLGSALVLAAILALGPIRDFAQAQTDRPAQARALLAAGGYGGVSAGLDPASDALLFTGSVADDQQLAQLREQVAAKFPHARLDVDTAAALARAATDILAAAGLDAEAQAEGPGRIVILTEYLPADRQRELREQLQADLPALRRARFELAGQRGPDDLAYFFNSSRYGLATYVDGEPGYLVTADGSYWFEGAILPTGHEILSLSQGRVTLRRNGLVEYVVVDPGGLAASRRDAARGSRPNSPLSNTPSSSQSLQGENT